MHTETLKKEISLNNLQESRWKVDTAKTILISAIVSALFGLFFVYLNNAKDIEIANLKGQIEQLKAKGDSK